MKPTQFNLVVCESYTEPSDDVARLLASVKTDAALVTKAYLLRPEGRPATKNHDATTLAGYGVLSSLDDFNTLSAEWTLFLRAGDRITPSAIAQFRKDLREGIGQDLYILKPCVPHYLMKGLGKRHTLVADSDIASPWTGLTGFAVRTATLKTIRHAALDSPIAISEIFLSLFAAVGRARLLARAVKTNDPLDDKYAATNYPALYDPQWYMRLNTFFSKLKNDNSGSSGSTQFLDQVYLYMLWRRIQSNKNAADRRALDNGRYERFLVETARILRNIHVSTISRPAFGRIDVPTRIFLVGLGREAKHLNRAIRSSDMSLTADEYPYVSASEVKLRIECMNYANGVLNIDGRYDFPMPPQSQIEFVYDGKRIPACITERSASLNIFGQHAFQSNPFTLSVPLRKDRVRPLRAYLISRSGPDRTEVLLDFTFPRPASRLTGTKGDFWPIGPYVLQYRASRIVVRPSNTLEKLKYHIRVIRRLRRSNNSEARAAARIRLLYLLCRPYFRNKRVWLYFDKLYKAGDNGEYAFRQALKHNDGIIKRYILRSDSPDSSRFRRNSWPCVSYRSTWQILLFLNAEVVFATHSNIQNFGGHDGRRERYYRGIYRYKVVLIQHGLTVQNFERTLNRVYDNIDTYCVASPFETRTLCAPSYDHEASRILPTGLARYDGLDAERTERRILISPTWRNYLAAPPNMGKARGYNEDFRNSIYFSVYNGLINNQTLLKTTREFGYRITFLLHPVTSSQRSDFEANGDVEILAATDEHSYEDLLSTAAILVTDFSGIQFDFAYMRKPVVYLHDERIPATYDESVYNYATDALGTVCTTSDDVVEELCALMANGARATPLMLDKIDNFYYHSDRDNAERIYQASRERFG